ncbi:hypothetical protein HK104_002780, partial [Borealophlyctis nickersoniae]
MPAGAPARSPPCNSGAPAQEGVPEGFGFCFPPQLLDQIAEGALAKEDILNILQQMSTESLIGLTQGGLAKSADSETINGWGSKDVIHGFEESVEGPSLGMASNGALMGGSGVTHDRATGFNSERSNNENGVGLMNGEKVDGRSTAQTYNADARDGFLAWKSEDGEDREDGKGNEPLSPGVRRNGIPGKVERGPVEGTTSSPDLEYEVETGYFEVQSGLKEFHSGMVEFQSPLKADHPSGVQGTLNKRMDLFDDKIKTEGLGRFMHPETRPASSAKAAERNQYRAQTYGHAQTLKECRSRGMDANPHPADEPSFPVRDLPLEVQHALLKRLERECTEGKAELSAMEARLSSSSAESNKLTREVDELAQALNAKKELMNQAVKEKLELEGTVKYLSKRLATTMEEMKRAEEKLATLRADAEARHKWEDSTEVPVEGRKLTRSAGSTRGLSTRPSAPGSGKPLGAEYSGPQQRPHAPDRGPAPAVSGSKELRKSASTPTKGGVGPKDQAKDTLKRRRDMADVHQPPQPAAREPPPHPPLSRVPPRPIRAVVSPGHEICYDFNRNFCRD